MQYPRTIDKPYQTIRGLRRTLFLKCALAFPLVLAATGSIYGSQIAFEFGTAPTTTDNPLSLGFQFTTDTALVISTLGYYDDGGDGLLTSHEVGIFDANGTLLTSTTINSGTVDPLIGHFRYGSIAPFTIGGSLSFTIAATTGGSSDPWAYGTSATLTGLALNPLITVASNAGRFVYQANGGLHYPAESFGYTLYAGPNFGFDPAPVPEPGTFALLGLVILPAFLLSLLSRSSRIRRLRDRPA